MIADTKCWSQCDALKKKSLTPIVTYARHALTMQQWGSILIPSLGVIVGVRPVAAPTPGQSTAVFLPAGARFGSSAATVKMDENGVMHTRTPRRALLFI